MHLLYYTGHDVLSTSGLSTFLSVGLFVGAFMGALSGLWLLRVERDTDLLNDRIRELEHKVELLSGTLRKA